jgi:hypothetical protein
LGRDIFDDISVKTVTVKAPGSVSAYNSIWREAFKGVGGSASVLNTGNDAGVENTNITLNVVTL